MLDERCSFSMDLMDLTLYMLVTFSCFCCHLLTVFKINFCKKILSGTHRVTNDLDPDQDRQDTLSVVLFDLVSCFTSQ